LIDSHAHLQDREFNKDLDKVLARATEAGVEKIVCIGFDYMSSRQGMDLARRHKSIFATVGIHPHDAKTLDEQTLEKLYDLALKPRVVAIGEIGLDYYRNLSPREQQKKAFIEQIKLAQELEKPVVIHDRDAHQEVLEIIKKEKAGINGGVMHCYSGHTPLALELIKEGFYISFAGPLTFKNAKKSHEVAQKIPLDRILIETDCPYLSPEPFRGKRNEPAQVKLVAQKLAELRGMKFEEIARITSNNARKVLKLPVVEGYGLTEASPSVCFNPLHGIQKEGSIGLPLPYVKCKVVDENDMEVPVGEVGELLVQGENVMLGYYKQEKETKETLRNGWLHTGDLARQDEDGYYYIVERKKDLVIVGGLNVYPSEIEEVIYKYPKVKETAVVGIQDKLRGEYVKAFIVLKEGEECTAKEISKFLRERIASYKMPRVIEFISELPKNASGKILKRILKTM
jgi:TatD DNase family protein